MTAERKIVVTAVASEPLLIWRARDTPPDELMETLKNRKAGEDIFLMADDDDLKLTVIPGAYDPVLALLKTGWKLDPFFHTSGRPWTVNFGHVWVLVKGTPEEIAELNPYVELPRPEVTEDDQRTIDKFAGIVDVLDLKPTDFENGTIADLCKKGYEIFNILKGSVILVKRKDTAPYQAPEEKETPGEVNA